MMNEYLRWLVAGGEGAAVLNGIGERVMAIEGDETEAAYPVAIVEFDDAIPPSHGYSNPAQVSVSSRRRTRMRARARARDR